MTCPRAKMLPGGAFCPCHGIEREPGELAGMPPTARKVRTRNAYADTETDRDAMAAGLVRALELIRSEMATPAPARPASPWMAPDVLEALRTISDIRV